MTNRILPLPLLFAGLAACAEDPTPIGATSAGLDLSLIESEAGAVTVAIEEAIAEAHRCAPCASGYDLATIYVPNTLYGCSEVRRSCLAGPCPAGTVCSAVGQLCWDLARHQGCGAAGFVCPAGSAVYCDHGAGLCLEAYNELHDALAKRVAVAHAGPEPSCATY
jgi:hypothetical protein